MQKIQLKSVPRRSENIRWREFGTDGILLDPRSGDYFQVDDVGITIWKRMDGRKTVEKIVEELSSDFCSEEGDMVKDTIEFMERLVGEGLISVEP